MSMATRALAAAVNARRRGGVAAALSSRRRGGARGMSHSSAQRRREDHQGAGDRHDAAAQVEASQNRKNVEVVQGDRSATLLPDEAADALRGVGVGGAEADDAAWVPDHETGVFVPAEEAAANGAGRQPAAAGAPSVLDQAVFVREEDMEDVERPAVDMAWAPAPSEQPLHARRPASVAATNNQDDSCSK